MSSIAKLALLSKLSQETRGNDCSKKLTIALTEARQEHLTQLVEPRLASFIVELPSFDTVALYIKNSQISALTEVISLDHVVGNLLSPVNLTYD